MFYFQSWRRNLRHSGFIRAMLGIQLATVDVNILPDILLIQIFEEALEDCIEDSRARVDCPQNRITLNLIRVCSRWRVLVKATPSMWKYIPLTAPYAPGHQIGISATDYYLSHIPDARKLVFHWPRVLPDIPRPPSPPEPSPYFNAKLERLYRFRANSTKREGEPLSFYLQQRPERHKALLLGANSIEIIARDIYASTDRPFNCQFPAECYTFRELLPNSISSAVSARLSVLVISIRYIYFSQLARVLKSTPELTALQVHVKEGFLTRTHGDSIGPPIPLKKLRHLLTSPWVAAQMLEYMIDVPALTQLTLQKSHYSTDKLLDVWNIGVKRCHLDTRITHLTLAGIMSRTEAELTILPSVSNWKGLKHLTLRGTNQSSILEAMMANGEVLTSVNELILEETDISMDLIRNVIDSRRGRNIKKDAHGNTMQRLVFDRCKGINRAFCDDVAQELDRMEVYC
jgi:hypothetical protein